MTPILLFLPFIAFGQSLTQGFAPIDDALLVYENAVVWGITLDNLRTIFTSYDPELYIPFTFLSYQINFMLGGLEPFVYHLTNLLLHACNAVFVAILLRKLCGDRFIAYVLAAIFAVHPLNTEAAVWIAARKDVLSTFFFLLAFLWYIDAHQQSKKLWASLLFFVCGLLSKVTVATLPVVLLLYDYKYEKISWKRIAPFLSASFLFGCIAMGGKTRVVGEASIIDTALMAAKSTVFYLQKFLMPTELSIVYPYRDDIALTSTFVVPIIIIFLVGYIVWRQRWMQFGLLTFLVTLAPTFLHFQKGDLLFFAVDRYMYIPMIGLLIALGSFLSCARKDIAEKVMIGLLIIIPVFTGMSIAYARTWNTPEDLFTNALEHYPESILARTGLARLYREQGKIQKAFNTLRDGLPYGDHMHMRLGAGTIYAKTGQVHDAREHFQAAMQMAPENPEPHFYLGSLEQQLGNTKIAQELFEEAVVMDTSYVVARNRLGNMYLHQQRYEEALSQFLESIAWNPSSLDAYRGVVSALKSMGRESDIAQYEEKIDVLMR